MALRTRNDREGEGRHSSVLRQRPQTVLLERLLNGGEAGPQGTQKFPDDYDGIIAGAPANRTAISLWIAHAVLKDPASYIPPGKYPTIHQAALAACDPRDGLKDGLIDDPTRCDFDPKVLLCKGG